MRLGLGKDPGTPLNTEIIGVVKDARFNNVGDEPPYLVFFSRPATAAPCWSRRRLDGGRGVPGDPRGRA